MKIKNIQSTFLPSPKEPKSKILEILTSRNIVLLLVTILLAIGVVMIYSTSAMRRLDLADPSKLLRKQILWVSLSWTVLILLWHTNYRDLYKYKNQIYATVVLLLIAVLIPGIGAKINGARRWLRLMGIGIQPSEIAKLVAILISASYVCQNQEKLHSFQKAFLPMFSLIALLAGLVLIEPDFGTALFILTISSAIFIVGGTPLRHFLPLLLAGLPAITIAMIWKFDHVKSRLLVFLYPDLDPLNKGHQIRQSLIAIGSGGFSGLGLGASRQKLFFLPEDHTDFIFAIIAEELGLIGTWSLILLLLALLWWGRKIMNAAPDRFGRLLAFGILFSLTLQSALNIAVVTASIPTKGISLPFISFGGSSMICSMAAVGILLNIADSKRKKLCQQLLPQPTPNPS